MKNTMIKEKIRNLDSQYIHPSYSIEKKLHRQVKAGSKEDAINTLKEFLSLERPALANDKIRSAKNALIVSCTLYTRTVIDAGVAAEDAFDLSDAMIKNVELLDDLHKLYDFEFEMLIEFINLKNRTSIKKYQYPVSKIVNYIHEHATNKITISKLSEITRLSPDYISKVFHKEVGISLTDYIQKQKVEVSKNFLIHHDMKITDIATLLEFCNHGYFSIVFKKHTGLTPMEYRKTYKPVE